MDEHDWLAEQFEAQPDPPAGGGLPDARLAERGGRRRPGGLAAAQPLRHERRREPGRLADDGRRAGLPRHAALAQGRGARSRWACTCPSRSSAARTGPTPSTRRCWPTRSVSRCSWCSRRWLPPSGSRSCCTTCSPCPSTRSPPSWAAPRPRPGSSRAAPAAGCRERPRSPTPISPASARSSTPSSPPRASGDFDALLAVLDPDVVLRADGGAVPAGASREVRGAPAVAEQALTVRAASPGSHDRRS